MINDDRQKAWARCHACQLRLGGKVPDHGHNGITVHFGDCPECGHRAMLVPNADYDWPKKGQKAIWD